MRKSTRFSLLLLSALLVSLSSLLLLPGTAYGHASLLRADPAPNSAVQEAPARVRLWFSEPIEPRFSGIEVYDASRNRVDAADFRAEGADGKGASIGLPDLPDGTYTVSWHNLSKVDGHSLAGAYAFSVGDAPPPVTVQATQARSESEVPILPSALVKVFTFLGMAVLTGTFGFWSLVLSPTLCDCGRASGADSTEAAVGESMTARALVVARIGVLLVVLGTLAALVLQTVVASRLSLSSALGRPLLDLMGTRYGVIWIVRMLLLVVIAGLLLAPRIPWHRHLPWLVGLSFSAGVLLTMSLVGHSAASGQSEIPAWVPRVSDLSGHNLHILPLIGVAVAWLAWLRPSPRFWWVWLVAFGSSVLVLLATNLPITLDWLHLMAMSLWVGGLVQLLLAVPKGLVILEPAERAQFFRPLIARFSRLALPCVVVLFLTGVYAAWFHVRHMEALTGTAYGLSLMAKVALFLPLPLLGAANMYLGSDRLQGMARRFRSVDSALPVRRFLRAVRAEVLLVVLVLLATGVLTSLSPPTEMTSAAPRLAFSETVVTEEGNVTLSVDPAIAGSNSIGVQIEDADGPVTDASKVAVRFSMASEGIAESEAVAKHAGAGHYTMSGPHLGVPGTWKVEVVARRPGHDDARAIFEVPVVAPRVAEADGVRTELGLTPTIPRAGEGAELQLIVTDAAGEVLPGAEVGMTLLMPAHAHYEDVVLENLGGGRYATRAQLRMGGQWVAQVTIRLPGRQPADLEIKFDVAE